MGTRLGSLASSFVLSGALLGPATAQAEIDDLATRPRPTYVRVNAPSTIATPSEPFEGPPLILYLNRCKGGTSLTPGDESSMGNTSSIINAPMTLPEYPFGDASWNQVVSGVEDIFAPFNVIVTDEDPSPMPHDEAIVCGSSEGTVFEGAAGVAPFDCGRIPNAITFTFPATIGNDLRFTVETIAQEAAHAWGLDHSFKCEDPMTYLEGCGDKSFQNAAYDCGEYEARTCECTGQPTQNTYEHIVNTLGPSGQGSAAPTVQITSPTDGEVFGTGSAFHLSVAADSEAGLRKTELFMDGALVLSDSQSPFDGWPLSDAPAGDFEFYVRAVDIEGNEAFSNTIMVHVEAGGGEPEDPQDGGSSGGDEDDDAEDEGDTDDGDELTGYGTWAPSDTQAETGCGCTVESDRDGWLFGLFVLVGLMRRRRS